MRSNYCVAERINGNADIVLFTIPVFSLLVNTAFGNYGFAIFHNVRNADFKIFAYSLLTERRGVKSAEVFEK